MLLKKDLQLVRKDMDVNRHERVSNITLGHNSIGGVMVSVLASIVVDRGFEPDRVKQRTIILVFVASPINTPH